MSTIRLPPVGSWALPLVAVVAFAGAPAWAAPATLSRADQNWAEQALAHRGQFKIIAADPRSGLITVRVERAQRPAAAGRVLLAGPGYRIAAAAPASSGQPAASTAGGARLVRGMPLEQRDHPIICQGPRLLHIDSRNLAFTGEAVRAEDGCEVYITNSRIVAKGVAVVARGASVHVDNSAISGDKGAVSASHGAQVYARSSTFQGAIRRSGAAAFHDLGGNVGD